MARRTGDRAGRRSQLRMAQGRRRCGYTGGARRPPDMHHQPCGSTGNSIEESSGTGADERCISPRQVAAEAPDCRSRQFRRIEITEALFVRRRAGLSLRLLSNNKSEPKGRNDIWLFDSKLSLTSFKALYFFFAAVCFSNSSCGDGEASREMKGRGLSTNRDPPSDLFAKRARRCHTPRLRMPFNEHAALPALTRCDGASLRRAFRVDDEQTQPCIVINDWFLCVRHTIRPYGVGQSLTGLKLYGAAATAY